MTRYWTSDLHISHNNIIGFSDRPFNSVDHMNAELLRRWNATVTEEDEVWVVGDLALGQREQTVPWCAQFTGRKTLIPGNHDALWRGGKKNWADWIKLYADAGFTILDHPPGGYILTELGGHEVAVCHFPRHEVARHGDKYGAWRPQYDGWLIHGHTHLNQVKIAHQLHVGVDAWDFTPIPEEWLIALMEEPG